MPSHRLPSLDRLLVFDAAARQRSFTRAAVELFLTQSAVSRQVAALEEELGLPLFVRRHRALDLTDDGRRLAAAVAEALAGLQATVAQLRAPHGREVLTITTTPAAVAGLWLRANDRFARRPRRRMSAAPRARGACPRACRRPDSWALDTGGAPWPWTRDARLPCVLWPWTIGHSWRACGGGLEGRGRAAASTGQGARCRGQGRPPAEAMPKRTAPRHVVRFAGTVQTLVACENVAGDWSRSGLVIAAVAVAKATNAGALIA